MKKQISIFWFRRDLRFHDNSGLFHALNSGFPVLPVFIFDTEILDKLEDKKDKRVDFIHQTIASLKSKLNEKGSDLIVEYGTPADVWSKLLKAYQVRKVFVNNDYEPQTIERDRLVRDIVNTAGAEFLSFKDQTIFEKEEIVKDDGNPYTIFTPYSKKWRSKLDDYYLHSIPSEKHIHNFLAIENKQRFVSIEELGFHKTGTHFPSNKTSTNIVQKYAFQRDFPAINGTTHLGIHFRFGTISIREKVQKALVLSDTWLNELIWRDFYMMILFHFPHVATRAFKKEYEHIVWRNNEEEFNKWCEGKTGYPIVDAGMRELNETGYMHNRVRMIVASFLTKHLLIDWKWGEAYFAKKLLDFDLSANNGGWQWAAGCGTDAAPYFRVFNPTLQTEKFDKDHKYIKRWVPELGSQLYPTQIVDHAFARARCLEVYKKGLSR
jgi:deoxyribodipyrimidine photo-lyase